MKETYQPGFVYTVDVIKDGQVVDSETVHNLIPSEGLNHILSVLLAGGAQVPTWYIGLYEGNYTPTVDDLMATFPAAAVETTAYVSGTRMEFVDGAIASGSVDNSAAKAEFEFNGTKTVYGGFISSNSAKGNGSGTLLSAVRFGSPKVLESGSVLRVTAGFALVSV